MKPIYPKKLGKNSHIRVIAPSRSFKIISQETRDIANEKLAQIGITTSYSKNCDEMDEFISSSIKSRVNDLHEAFADKSVDAILTAIGGYNSVEILRYIDYDLIKNNPKIICGFSDITALTNAIYAKTGMVTYSGPHFSSFGMKKGIEHTFEYFKKCFLDDDMFQISASKNWSNDAWFLDQENRKFSINTGHWLINKTQDEVQGRIIGGNLGLLSSLQGSEYFPKLDNSILFIEHCAEDDAMLFNRGLQSLIHLPEFSGVKAILIGRFEEKSKMTLEMLTKIIKSKKELNNLPIIANLDFGHTTPTISFPIGGEVKLSWINDSYKVEILKH